MAIMASMATIATVIISSTKVNPFFFMSRASFLVLSDDNDLDCTARLAVDDYVDCLAHVRAGKRQGCGAARLNRITVMIDLDRSARRRRSHGTGDCGPVSASAPPDIGL
jgi:hypothetical protein